VLPELNNTNNDASLRKTLEAVLNLFWIEVSRK
jgi:hypothetical protein